MKNIISTIFSILILLIFFAVIYNIGDFRTNSMEVIEGEKSFTEFLSEYSESAQEASSSYSSTNNFEDINRNPEIYINQEIELTGKVQLYFLSYYDKEMKNGTTIEMVQLIDDEGFFIYVDPSIDRKYTKGSVYSFNGIIKENEFLKEKKYNPQINNFEYIWEKVYYLEEK